LEVAVSIELTDGHDQPVLSLPDLERIVHDTVIMRFDHTNLNLDCPEFESLNPSVEHIAGVCFELLDEPVRQTGAELHHVTIWETPKTSATVARGHGHRYHHHP
jgi:6-pyruvoyltetrahydropterin/6-carboxytetrahydropterin synthase